MAGISKIISGGQTGADRGGLDAAIELGLPHGGWCPLARLAEDGRIPERYQLTESFSANYAVRTNRNVVDADGTVVFTLARPPAKNSGSELTVKFCNRHAKPCLLVDLSEDDAVSRKKFLDWIEQNRVGVLNVAGSRESEAPGISAGVRAWIVAALRSQP